MFACVRTPPLNAMSSWLDGMQGEQDLAGGAVSREAGACTLYYTLYVKALPVRRAPRPCLLPAMNPERHGVRFAFLVLSLLCPPLPLYNRHDFLRGTRTLRLEAVLAVWLFCCWVKFIRVWYAYAVWPPPIIPHRQYRQCDQHW